MLDDMAYLPESFDMPLGPGLSACPACGGKLWGTQCTVWQDGVSRTAFDTECADCGACYLSDPPPPDFRPVSSEGEDA